jgi:hypothetical protein
MHINTPQTDLDLESNHASDAELEFEAPNGVAIAVADAVAPELEQATELASQPEQDSLAPPLPELKPDAPDVTDALFEAEGMPGATLAAVAGDDSPPPTTDGSERQEVDGAETFEAAPAPEAQVEAATGPAGSLAVVEAAAVDGSVEVAALADEAPPVEVASPLETGDAPRPATLPEPAAETESVTEVPGAEWGYLDDEGTLWQRDGELHKGRALGKTTGANPAIAFGFYAGQFDQFVRRVEPLAAEIEAASNKAPFLGRVRRLAEQAPTIEGLGDFDALIRRLQAIEAGISDELAGRREQKDRLAARAEALQESTDWKAAGDELRVLFEEWKTVGTLGREEEQALWERFNTARQTFYGRREAFFAERNQERADNLAKKEDLCARAEALQDSTDWKATSNALKAFQAEWKGVGSAGREQDQALWARFRGAMDVFFANRTAQYAENKRTKESICAAAEALADSTDWAATGSTLKGLQEQWKQTGFAGGDVDDAFWTRFRRALDAFYGRRSENFAERDRHYGENLGQKEALVAETEALLLSDDFRTATQRVKALQEQWRTIGPVPRERADEIWNRFRTACDTVFTRARDERERRQNAWKTTLKDSLDRQRAFARELMDSIGRDDELLDRWQGQLDALRPGGREAEVRRDLASKIAGLQQRILGKQNRIEELLVQIAEMDARLAAEASR